MAGSRNTAATPGRRETGGLGVSPRRATASILTPTLDLLAVGGLSIVVLLPLLLSGRTDLLLIGAGAQAWVATAINMPHFMASYRLVYRDRAAIRAHPWAAVWVPLLLLAYVAVALWQAQQSTALVILLVTVSSTYLAWHYTGQVWGMMATFTLLDGRSYTAGERRLIRGGLSILLAWHLTWFLYTQLRDPARVALLYRAVTWGTAVAFGLGAAGLASLWRRTGRVPPLRAVVPWLALFVWYAVMARDPKALFWVQIAHALQYLAFPVRMELNMGHARGQGGVTRLAVYGALLLGVSVLVAQVVPVAAMGAVGALFGETPGRSAPILLLSVINIHHYFTDGVLWKLRNPAVRGELLAHLPPRP